MNQSNEAEQSRAKLATIERQRQVAIQAQFPAVLWNVLGSGDLRAVQQLMDKSKEASC